jgi:hypothetical protein
MRTAPEPVACTRRPRVEEGGSDEPVWAVPMLISGGLFAGAWP